MPETACLHIQSRDSDPIRVVALPGVSIRIGRASYCEVRLPEAGLADEECHLRRRGSTWHLVPVASPCSITIEGHAVERPRPLPYGVALRVGEHSLTLRPTAASAPEWNRSPVTALVPVPTVAALVPEVSRTEPRRELVPVLSAADPGTRWQARREGLKRTSQEEKRWEARWKAAGEKLRASAPVAAPLSAEPVRAPQRPQTWTEAELPRRDAERAPVPPAGRPDRSGFPSVAAVATRPKYPAVAPVTPPLTARTSSVDAAPSRPYEPPKSTRTPVARAPLVAPEVRREPTTEPPLRPRFDSPTRSAWGRQPAQAVLAPTRREVESTLVPPLLPTVEEPAERPRELIPARTLGSARPLCRSAFETEALVPDAAPLSAVETPEDLTLTVAEEPELGFPLPILAEVEPAAIALPCEPASLIEPGPDAGEAASSVPHDLAEPEPEPDPSSWVEPGPIVNDTRDTELANWSESRPPLSLSTAAFHAGEDATPSGIGLPADHGFTDQLARIGPNPGDTVSARDWPAARDILAAHQARKQPRPEAKPQPGPRRRKPRPLPTAVCEPEHWNVPLWLGWLPLTLVACVLGAGGVALSWIWSQDAKTAALIANHLATAPPGAKLPVPPEALAAGPWWRSTGGNLALLAAALGRTGDPALQKDAESLALAAIQAAPFQPAARFARAHAPGRDGEPAPLAQGLGLSRDVVALAWSGHQLLKGGKKDAALKSYSAALEMAATAEVARLAPPAYNDDPLVRRYALPGEELIGTIVRDMAENGEWSDAEWSATLPRFAVVPLVAARALRESHARAADAALDAIIAQVDQPPPAGTTTALHVAAQAEAFALKSDWAKADALYRQAIDRMPSPKVRRSWWVNVADLSLRLNDESARQQALEAANSHDPNDEITRRVIEIQNSTGFRAEKASPRALGVKKTADKS